MTNCTRLFGTTAALILAAGACADLQYGDAILSAESNCFAGSDYEQIQQSIGIDSSLEVNTSCGGGSTSAYLETGDSWFILSAGSSVAGQGSSGSDAEVPVIIDGGNGAAAVEIEFTVDAPTLFRLSRSLEGSKVRFWDGDYQIAVLNNSDEETQLPQGTYWATVETDEYGTPVWAEIDWSQQEKDKPADLNGDGKLDAKDLAVLISIISDAKGEAKSDKDAKSDKKPEQYPTGGDCTEAKSKSSGKLSATDSHDKATPMPRPKPQGGLAGDDNEFKTFDKPSDKGPELGDNSSSNGKAPSAPTGINDGPGATNEQSSGDSIGSDQPGESSPQLGDNSSSKTKAPSAPTGINDGPGATADKGSDKGSDKVKPLGLPKVKTKGDLDGDGKVDIKDIVFLMARI